MSNPWKQFEKLLAPGAKTVATVTSVNTTTGTSVVTLRGGSSITVTGDSVAAGKQAFVQDGKIVGKAPSLTAVTVDV